jgi:hypothetical protein
MKFTKKHFYFFAEYLKTTKANTKTEITKELIEIFEKDNPKFKKDKFLKYAGLMAEFVQLDKEYSNYLLTSELSNIYKKESGVSAETQQ